MTRGYSNPLVEMDIKWTAEMANDLRRYETEINTVIPGCWNRNITSIEVSIY